jgi:MFS superfamily sulfate permease-like transporter
MRFPVFGWLRGYDRGWARGDVIAGLTVWAVLVPESLAYASIAGVSPVVGLYAGSARAHLLGGARDVVASSGEEVATQRIFPTVEATVEAANAGGPPPRR